MKTIEQIARELGDDWDTTLPEDKVFIENVAKAYLSAWLEQQSQEPVAYMAPSGTCVTAEDVSYTPNWTDYYTIPLYAAPPAKVDQQSQEPVAWMSEDKEDYSYGKSNYFCVPLFLAPPAIPEGSVRWDLFPGYLIDHHEGDILSEELLQSALAGMLKAAQGEQE